MHHLLREGGGLARVGTGLVGNQRALGGVVKRAGHFQRLHDGIVGQTGFTQKKVKAATAGEGGAGQHRAAHLAPQMVAQRGTGQDGASVAFDDDVVTIHLQREPFGIGHAFRAVFAGFGLLAQQLGGVVHGLQAWSQRAHLGVQLRQALRFVGFVFDLGLEGLGNGPQHVQKAAGVVHDLRQGVEQGMGHIAAWHACTGRSKALIFALELVAVMLHHQAGQLGQVLAQAAAVARNVGNLVHFHQLAHTQGAAGQFVDPLQAAHVHLTRKLREGRLRQMVGFVQHQQAVIQVRQQPCPQAGEQ